MLQQAIKQLQSTAMFATSAIAEKVKQAPQKQEVHQTSNDRRRSALHELHGDDISVKIYIVKIYSSDIEFQI